MVFCKNTALLTGGSSTHKTSAGASALHGFASFTIAFMIPSMHPE